jgi:hypothetical protein
MNNINSIGHRQHGLSFVGWMGIVAVVGLLIITSIKIIPIYMENFTIQSVLKGVQEDQKIDPKSKRAIWDTIKKRLFINEIHIIKRENVKIVRKEGKTTITVTYETRRPYIADLSLVGSFTESVVIDR